MLLSASSDTGLLGWPDAFIVAATKPYLGLVWGDSNVEGQLNANNISSALEFGANSAFASVTLAAQLATNTNDPPPFGTEFGPTALVAHNPGNPQGFGPEITLGRQLFDISPKFGYLVECGITASMLHTHWLPTANYPSGGGPNLYHSQVTRAKSYETLSGRQTKIIFLNLGTNDASDSTAANAMAANMAAMVTQVHVDFPNAVIVWPLIHVSTAQTFTSTVRTQQLSYAATAPAYFMLLNIDHLTLQDPFHWDTNSGLTIGPAVAFAGADLMGLPRRTVGPAPAIVGHGVPLSGSAASLSPLAWPGTTDTDTELLFAVGSGLTPGGGAGTQTVSSPAGWTPVTNGQITAVGFTTTWRVFSRPVGAGEIETDTVPPSKNRRAVAVTVSFANSTDNWSKRLTVRGPNPHPVVDAAASTAPNTFGQGPLSIGALTTSADNALVIYLVGGGLASVPATATLTTGGLTGVTKYSETYHPMPDGNSVLTSFWDATLPIHGTTGTASATFSVLTLEFAVAIALIS